MIIDPDEKTQKKIQALLLKNPGLSITSIAEKLQLSIPLVDKNLQNLVNSKVISIEKNGNYLRYYVEKQNNNLKLKLRDQSIQNIQQDILELIRENPGLHLSKIADILDISNQLTDYHLLRLEKENKVNGIKDSHGYYKRYYLTDSNITPLEKKLLGILRKKIQFKIILYLLKHKTLTHKDMTQLINISTSHLTYHLTNLVNSDIIEPCFINRRKCYQIKDRKVIIDVIKKYNINIHAHHIIEDFKDIWDDLIY